MFSLELITDIENFDQLSNMKVSSISTIDNRNKGRCGMKACQLSLRYNETTRIIKAAEPMKVTHSRLVCRKNKIGRCCVCVDAIYSSKGERCWRHLSACSFITNNGSWLIFLVSIIYDWPICKLYICGLDGVFIYTCSKPSNMLAIDSQRSYYQYE